MSPLVNTSRAISPTDARIWVQNYAQLLALAHQCIARNLAGTCNACHSGTVEDTGGASVQKSGRPHPSLFHMELRQHRLRWLAWDSTCQKSDIRCRHIASCVARAVPMRVCMASALLLTLWPASAHRGIRRTESGRHDHAQASCQAPHQLCKLSGLHAAYSMLLVGTAPRRLRPLHPDGLRPDHQLATLQAAVRLSTTLTGTSLPCRDAQHAVRQPGSHLDHPAVPERCIPRPMPPGRLAVPEHPVGHVRTPDSAFVRQACALAKAVQACIRAATCAGMNPPACPCSAGRCMPGSDACRAGLEVWLPADARLLGGAELHNEQRMV